MSRAMKRRPEWREEKEKSDSASVGIVASKVASSMAWMKARRRAIGRRGVAETVEDGEFADHEGLVGWDFVVLEVGFVGYGYGTLKKCHAFCILVVVVVLSIRCVVVWLAFSFIGVGITGLRAGRIFVSCCNFLLND